MLISKAKPSLRDKQRAFFPWATALILAVVLTIALWQQQMGWDLKPVAEWLFVPGALGDATEPWWDPSQWLTALTSIGFHSDWWHFGGNVIFLLLFAIKLERWIKPFWLVFSVVVCGSLANLILLLQDPPSVVPVVGLSGSVSALIGLLFTLSPLARIGVILPLGVFFEQIKIPIILLVGAWLLLQLGYSQNALVDSPVAWWTHIGGFLLGCLVGLLARLFGFRVSHAEKRR